MNKKYLLIIIILAIISISAVNAVSDENITASADDDIIATETQPFNSNEEILSADLNNEEKVSAGETGTFADLYNLINNAPENSVIDLDKNYTYDSSKDYNQKSGVSISKPITIDGHGYTLSGNDQVRILYIKSSNVVLKNIIFKNANQKNGEKPSDNRGGAIYADFSDNLEIFNSTFIDNKASNYAGAIYEYNCDNTKIINSTFIHNSGSAGGAIYHSSSDNHLISESTFINNSALSNSGGSIYLYTSDNSLIYNSKFINSSASADGNSIYVYSNNIIVNGSSFINYFNLKNEIFVKKDSKGAQINNSVFNGSKIAISSEKSIDLNNNTLSEDSYIYIEDGKITSELNIIVINNETRNSIINHLLTARITDDNNNSIKFSKTTKLQFIIQDEGNFDAVLDENNVWTLNHTFSEFDKEYVISAYYADYPSVAIHKGIVNVNIVERYVDITSAIEDIEYGQNASLKLILNETTARGNITIYLNDKKYETVELTDDLNTEVEIKFDALNAGSYDVTIEYEGDGYYLAKTFKNSFKVNKIDPTINIDVSDIKIGEDAFITVTLPNGATGSVTVKVNGETYHENEILLSGLKLGEYDISVTYEGDINYNPSENTSSFTVSKKESAISIDSDVAVIGLNTTITLTVNDGATGNILINISGETYNFNLSDGREFKIVLDHVGKYSVNATYLGDGEFKNSTSETILVEVIDKYVPKIKINVPQNVIVGSLIEIDVETDGFDPVVKINNVEYQLNEGKVEFTPQNIGLYTVIVFTSENETYVAGYNLTAFSSDKINDDNTLNSNNTQNYQSIIHQYTLDSNKDLNEFYNSGATYTVRVLVDGKVAGAGETVSIVFNGKTTKVKTDKNGLIKFNVADKNVKPGLYTVTVKYQGQSVANIITVKSVITAKKTTKVKKSAKSFKVKITLKGKNIKKQTVKVKFKGKTYTLKTNAKGVATLKVTKKAIKKLKKGKTYSYTITYNKDVLKRDVKVI